MIGFVRTPEAFERMALTFDWWGEHEVPMQAQEITDALNRAMIDPRMMIRKTEVVSEGE